MLHDSRRRSNHQSEHYSLYAGIIDAAAECRPSLDDFSTATFGATDPLFLTKLSHAFVALCIVNQMREVEVKRHKEG